MIKIGVIGRNLNNSKWSPLFSILDDAKESEVLEYNKYSLDNGKKYEGSDEQYLIFLATTPNFIGGKDYIQFSVSADETLITTVMQEFADRIFGEPEIEKYVPDVPNVPEIEIQDSINETPEFLEPVIEELIKGYVPPIGNNPCTESEIIPDPPKKLEGVIVEFNNKQAYLSLEDADKLKELLESMTKSGLKIVDIVVNQDN